MAKINNKFMLCLGITSKYRFINGLIGLLLLPVWSGAQSVGSIFDRLSGEEILEVELRGDFAKLLEDKHSGEAIDAVFTVEQRGERTSRNVELSLRGRFRRMTCDFPPLMMRFKKKELRREGLSEHNDIKLVTHCLESSSVSKKNILKEYLAYKLLSLLTDYSFRVQLARITYVDTSGLVSDTRRYAILVEDEDELAERLNAKECKDCLNPDITRMDLADLALVSVFQYMIGNTDWSVLMNRNVKLFEETTDGTLLSVPYDFDYSGWVNAPYAKPNPDLGQVALTDRIYVGIMLNTSLKEQTFSAFRERKNAMYELVRGFKKLDATSRKALVAYLDSFYEHLENIDMKFANRAMIW
jgi:hypothetical protein